MAAPDSIRTGTPSRGWVIAGASCGTAVVGALSAEALRLSASRCATSPPNDTSSEWHFSAYCNALSWGHVVDYPDWYRGGGPLNLIFLIPALLMIGAAMRLARHGWTRVVGRAGVASVALAGLLLLLSLTAASVSLQGGG